MWTQKQIFNKINALKQDIDSIAACVQNDFDHPDSEEITIQELKTLSHEMSAQLYKIACSADEIKRQSEKFFMKRIMERVELLHKRMHEDS